MHTGLLLGRRFGVGGLKTMKRWYAKKDVATNTLFVANDEDEHLKKK